MANDVIISYNGDTVVSLSDSGIEALETSGKFCESDIVVEYTKPSPNLQAKSVIPTTSVQTVIADSGYDGLSQVSVAAISFNLQAKSASPTTSSQTITADSGYDGLSQVTVNAISPTKSSQTYTPTTTDQTIASGRWLTGAQTIKGDANLVAGNIKSGVSIFGVTGNYEGGGGSDTVVDFIENHDAFASFEHSSVTKIGQGTFAYCSDLQTVSFPACTSIGSSAFAYCSRLSTASFPSCTSIESNAFASCTYLQTVSFPSCARIGSSAFYNCTHLQTLSFPACINIGASVFGRCFNFVSLYLLGSSLVSLVNSNAFLSTPIAGYTTSTGGVYGSIYVPSSLLSSYKTATNWTYFSSRIVGI